MTPELLQTLVHAGGFGLAVWMLNNVWNELKVQNDRIYQLLQAQNVLTAHYMEIVSQMRKMNGAPMGATPADIPQADTAAKG